VFFTLSQLIATTTKFSTTSTDDPVNCCYVGQRRGNWQWELAVAAKASACNKGFSTLVSQWMNHATYEANENREWNYTPLTPR